MKRLTIRITQRKGTDIIALGLNCRVNQQVGSDEEVAAMLLEAEMNGNSSGKCRVHIFGEKEEK